MSDYISDDLKERIRQQALQINNTSSVTVRRAWVSVGWHPPKEP